MKIIDKNNWERKEVFDFFSNMKNPFFNIAFPLDVTRLYDWTKRNGMSFYLSLVWLCTQTVNSIENFRYGVENGEVVLYNERIPSFTDLKKGSDVFHIVTMPCDDNIIDFCTKAKEKSLKQTAFIDFQSETGNLIYFSCVPWLDFTSLTNESDFHKDDSIPRITWGKYVQTDGKKVLHMSLEINHRFTDGLHVGKFFEKLNDLINAL